MAAASWQEAAAQQAEEAAARVRDVLSGGLGLLRTELGLELGLDPQGLPTWLALVGPAALGLLLLGLLLAAACGGGFRKKRARSAAQRKGEEAAGPGLTGGGGPSKAAAGAGTGQLLLKGEEQKKRNKKKLVEKAARPNGQSILDVSEDEIMQTVRRENIKQPLDAEKKNEKSKKKKKSKGDAKTVQDVSRLDGKEVDEGTWETKISNREKRQQRKRDKVLTDTGSGELNLQGMENAVTVSIEQLMPTPSLPVGLRKNKGDTLLNVQVSNSKTAKGESAIPQVSPGLNESHTVNGGSWNEKPVKISSQIGVGEEKWTSVSSATAGKRKTETSAWGQDTGDANGNGKDWGVTLVGRPWKERSLFTPIAAWNVDARINTSEQNSTSFSSFGLTPGVSGSNSESASQAGTSDFQWDLSHAQPPVDDEWSGLNGLSSADPSSDWNAPAEEWGNWVDEEKVASVPQPEETSSDVQKTSDNEREKADPLQSSGSGKSKKKKKKKKKQGEEANSPAKGSRENNERKEVEETSSLKLDICVPFTVPPQGPSGH
ncbi:protein LYRIC isoform X4 [Apteryx rowi]|uniref:protein LYRIC isoform X4 n=1 Tax=Apteryx rowi TaxID=308060 RepID=UPI000E1C98F0|nr:protein LYRIC isoform X4 [Apteryx rowi]